MPGIDQIVSLVANYQAGQYRDGAADRVNEWLTVFAAKDRVAIADELAHILRRAFFTREQAILSVHNWLDRPSDISGGIVQTWEEATFLGVQRAGGSQRAVLDLLDAEAVNMGIKRVSRCEGLKLFVYVDDVSIHGMRILNDVTPWIKETAPRVCTLLIVLQRRLLGQQDYVTNLLTTRARAVGKVLQLHWWSDHNFSREDCYRPAVIPDDPVLSAYLNRSGVEPQLRYGNATGQYFSSNESRSLLETALLMAGISVIESNPSLSPRKYIRPLGNTIWRGLGLGVPIVTWRNCPNSAPLSLWADGQVPALFPREAN